MTTRTRKAIAGAASLVLLGAATWLIVSGLQGTKVEALPLPANEFAVADQDALAKVRNTEDPSQFPPNSVTIPVLGEAAYPISSSDSFYSTEYEGVDGLVIPDDPTQVAWFSDGAPVVGGEQGTTLLAAHIAVRGKQGAFWGAETLEAGDVVWTKDATGAEQAWAVTSVWSAHHTSFPQEYFAADGPRQLVLVTCGGELNEHGYYQYNIFVVGVPFTP